MIPWRPAILSCVLALSLAGCLGGTSKPTRFYVLTPLAGAAPGSVADAAGLSVELAPVRIPEYLDRPEIVVGRSANELELKEFHHWAGNLEKNMTWVLAENLSLRMPGASVTIPPSRRTTPPDYRLAFSILRFEAGPDGLVHLTTRWRIAKGSTRKVLAAGRKEMTSPPVDTANPGAMVEAMSRMLDELSQATVDALRGLETPAGS